MTCTATKMAHLTGIICAAAMGKKLLDIPDDKSGLILNEDTERDVARMAYTILDEIVPLYYRGAYFAFIHDMLTVVETATTDGDDEIKAVDSFIDALIEADRPVLIKKLEAA